MFRGLSCTEYPEGDPCGHPASGCDSQHKNFQHPTLCRRHSSCGRGETPIVSEDKALDLLE